MAFYNCIDLFFYFVVTRECLVNNRPKNVMDVGYILKRIIPNRADRLIQRDAVIILSRP
jgi:hypothetical protein